jgi:hypothetical protein
LRSFRVAAVGKNLWQMYSGEEPVLDKPRFHTMLVEAPRNEGKSDVPSWNLLTELRLKNGPTMPGVSLSPGRL